MAFVLDASIALAWYLTGQGNPYATAVYRRLNYGTEQASVPLLWRIELAAVLLKAHRRGEISEADARAALADAETLPVALYDLRLSAGEVFRLGKRYNLSGYDVHYFELAKRLNLPLATADRGIKSAAKRHQIAIYAP